MMTEKKSLRIPKVIFLTVIFAISCFFIPFCSSEKKQEAEKPAEPLDTIVLGAYTVPKEAYQKEIIPAFQEYWLKKTGRRVVFKESYNASGAQARAIAAGLEADIAALSLEQDTDLLVEKGLITHNWRARKYNGYITRSIVVMVHNPGNPKNIKDYEDLTADNVDVIYPSPRTSGGAMWIVNAIYGAGLKHSEKQKGQPDEAYARELLKKIQKRVKVMDSSARASVTTFENGFGDILLTYENEAILRQKQGKEFPFIIPSATILIENPIAIVDKNVDKHGSREVSEAFADFCQTPECQRHFANYGFRPVDENVLKEFSAQYPIPPDLFDMSYIGGWKVVTEKIYGPQGIWTQIIQELADEK